MEELLSEFVMNKTSLVSGMVTKASKMGKYLKWVNESHKANCAVADALGLSDVDDTILVETHKKAHILLDDIEYTAKQVVARLKKERKNLLNNSRVAKEDLPNVLLLASTRQKLKVTVTQLKLSIFKNRKQNAGRNHQVEKLPR